MTCKRDKLFDLIKGYTMILVVLGHGINQIMSNGLSNNFIWSLLYKAIYLFHMPLMFCVSGYLSGYSSTKSKKESILKDVISLYVPYLWLVYALLGERIVASRLWGIEGETKIDLSCWGLLSRFIHADGIAWFILSLFLVKVIVKLVSDFLSCKVLIVCSFVIVGLMNQMFPDYVYLVAYMPCYIVGYALKNCGWKKPSLLINCCGMLFLVGLFLNEFFGKGNILGENFAGMLVMFFLLEFSSVLADVKFVRLCGEKSMVLYLVHGVTNYPVFYGLMILTKNSLFIISLYTIITLLLFKLIVTMYTNFGFFAWVEYFFYPYKLYIRVHGKRKS